MLLALYGCSTTNQSSTAAAPEPVAPPSPQLLEQPISTSLPAAGSFSPETLYTLLVAELASQRDMPQLALHNYLQQAHKTRDLAIARQATHLAIQLRDPNALLETSLLWAELEPGNPNPYRLAATELIKRGEFERATPMVQRALAQGDLPVIDLLVERADKMSDQERTHYLDLLDAQVEQPLAPGIRLYTQAALLRHQDDPAPALILVTEALSHDPDFDRAILLEADLQARSGHLDTALSHLREELHERDHKQMRTLYLRLLLENEQYPLAEQQAETLVNNHPDDNNLIFYVAALLMEHGRLDPAEAYFEHLHKTLGSNSTLHYYLGRIAQLRNDRDTAITHYSRVNSAPYLLPSQAEVGRLLDQPEDREQLRSHYNRARQQHPGIGATLFALEGAWLAEKAFRDDAMATYNDGISAYPDDTRLRYNRAMLAEQRDDLVLMEDDLRHLLGLEPDNAMALNALGYSLTDRTDRHQEALPLIRRALELKPDDPAILDSMGWVYFNLGQLDKALDYLQQAYSSFPDPEIATHLGKVLWALGEHSRAMAIWEEALTRDPDSQLLLDAVAEVRTEPSE